MTARDWLTVAVRQSETVAGPGAGSARSDVRGMRYNGSPPSELSANERRLKEK